MRSIIASLSILAAVALVAPAAWAPAAWAHAALREASPAVGSTVAKSPTEISLKFSEGVEPELSSITLSLKDGAKFATGKAGTGGKDKRFLTLKLPKALAPGAYTVHWAVVSIDSHKTEGSYSFEIKP